MINNFILLLQKAAYPYKYMADQKNFNETSLLEKQNLQSHLNMGDTTNVGCTHAKRDCKDFEIKYGGEYRNLYVQSDI